MSPQEAKRVLAVRDAIILRDIEEAWHQLYGLADPTFTKLEPWALLEMLAARAGDGEPDPVSDGPVVVPA